MTGLKANRSSRYKQWIGALAGAALGWLMASLFPALEQRFSLLTIVLWCGAIGAVLTNLEGFAHAGSVLTRRENRAINLAVGLGIPALLLLLIGLLIN